MSENYRKKSYGYPPVPKGFIQFGKDENEFSISRENSEFWSWIPIDEENLNTVLKENSYCIGKKYACYDPIDELICRHIKSIKKYKGFYISSKKARKNLKGNASFTIIGNPWEKVSFYQAKEKSKKSVQMDNVCSCLPFGISYRLAYDYISNGGKDVFEFLGYEWSQEIFNTGKFKAPVIRELYERKSKLILSRTIINFFGLKEYTTELEDWILNEPQMKVGFRTILIID